MASMLMNPKRALALASRKWRKTKQSNEGEKTRVAAKGHFVVYTIEGRRFVVPLAYLDSAIFRELFRKSEDEFGHHCNRPITLPCDADFMECVVELLRR